jgi:hypothetical protein
MDLEAYLGMAGVGKIDRIRGEKICKKIQEFYFGIPNRAVLNAGAPSREREVRVDDNKDHNS